MAQADEQYIDQAIKDVMVAGMCSREIMFLNGGKDPIRKYAISQRARVLAQDALMKKKDAEIERLNGLINTPSIHNFMEAVRLEAGHQRERWAADQDAEKSDMDWFWLIGYLAGKALRPDNTQDKRLHHIVTTAAVCLNWHRHATGEATEMRPGIATPSIATYRTQHPSTAEQTGESV